MDKRKESTQNVTVHRAYKDRLFRQIFREKEELLKLYNALNGIQYTDATQMKYAKEVSLDSAVTRAVDESIEEGILAEFFRKYRNEAIEMCIFEYNEEMAMKYIREDEYSKGIRDGIKEGMVTGEERFSILTKSLIEDNREEDLIRATGNKNIVKSYF